MGTLTRTIKSWAVAGMFAAVVGGAVVAVAAPMVSPVSAATTCDRANSTRFLTLPFWYQGLNVSSTDCNIVNPNDVGGISNFIWRIVLNVVEIGLHLAGYIAVFFILYGGFQFLTSSGSPDGSAKARKTILSAVIGLVISIASVAIVNLILRVIV